MAKVKPGICGNCSRANGIIARGLCGSCYEYERSYGKPKPPNYRLVPRDEFIEEWDHMTRRVGYPIPAAIYRLSDAFGMTERAVQTSILQYGLVAA